MKTEQIHDPVARIDAATWPDAALDTSILDALKSPCLDQIGPMKLPAY